MDRSCSKLNFLFQSSEERNKETAQDLFCHVNHGEDLLILRFSKTRIVEAACK